MIPMNDGSGRFMDEITGEVKTRYSGFLGEGEHLIKINAAKKKSRQGKMIEHVKFRSANKQIKAWEKLSVGARGVLTSMLLFLNWEENLVAGDGKRFTKDIPLNWVQIANYCSISKPTCIKVKAELEKHNVLKYYIDPVSKKNIGIAINPLFALKGDVFASRLVNLFTKGNSDIDKDLLEDDEKVDYQV